MQPAAMRALRYSTCSACVCFLAAALRGASGPPVESSSGSSPCEQARQEVLAGDGSVDSPLWIVIHHLALHS
ncbi:hypothetical protein CesoFtcFv8_017013 [Champsocephalus esox]|uniref:Secreted protein n=4 Tax=Champsocephalus TaxID=52236 RepID=A0AAN8D4J5_CHAGU|nr:hypothetical protein CesoFtcFv8_017013 [Champsocephalus esox]KAK5916406.1 hypothetical protein CgunFtcFv8_011394 [Champsocephalus gunnari]